MKNKFFRRAAVLTAALFSFTCMSATAYAQSNEPVAETEPPAAEETTTKKGIHFVRFYVMFYRLGLTLEGCFRCSATMRRVPRYKSILLLGLPFWTPKKEAKKVPTTCESAGGPP